MAQATVNYGNVQWSVSGDEAFVRQEYQGFIERIGGIKAAKIAVGAAEAAFVSKEHAGRFAAEAKKSAEAAAHAAHAVNGAADKARRSADQAGAAAVLAVTAAKVAFDGRSIKRRTVASGAAARFHVEIDLEKVLRREPNRRIVSTALELEKLRTQFSLGALADLPEKAKSIYALMLDLSEEAIERNVRDFGGQPYFYLTYVRVFELLGISSSKAIVNAIRDLEQRGLILRKQGSACEGKRIYLIDFTDITDTGDSAHEPDAVGSADADAIRKLRKSLENAPLVYLSEDVKQLCRLLLEREEVALDAGQVDETGQAYVLYNGKDIAEALSWSVNKAKKNLRVVSQCGLNIFKRELVGDGVTEKVVLGQLALRI